MDALRFSLASDIVELVVLTTDDPFLQTLREAVGASRRLWHVPSADKVSDLLVAGGVGILVLDVHALHETANRFITEIKRQFPDLVVVVAGNRDAETALGAFDQRRHRISIHPQADVARAARGCLPMRRSRSTTSNAKGPAAHRQPRSRRRPIVRCSSAPLVPRCAWSSARYGWCAIVPTSRRRPRERPTKPLSRRPGRRPAARRHRIAAGTASLGQRIAGHRIAGR